VAGGGGGLFAALSSPGGAGAIEGALRELAGGRKTATTGLESGLAGGAGTSADGGSAFGVASGGEALPTMAPDASVGSAFSASIVGGDEATTIEFAIGMAGGAGGFASTRAAGSGFATGAAAGAGGAEAATIGLGAAAAGATAFVLSLADEAATSAGGRAAEAAIAGGLGFAPGCGERSFLAGVATIGAAGDATGGRSALASDWTVAVEGAGASNASRMQ